MNLLGITDNPDNAWVTQVARTFASDLEEADHRPRFLVRDRDTKFTPSFDAVFSSIGIEANRTPVRSTRANAFAERLVRTVRDDCLEHLLIFGRRHLEAVLAEYIDHYNRARPHRGLDLDLPQPATVNNKTCDQTIRRRGPRRDHPRIRTRRLIRQSSLPTHGRSRQAERPLDASRTDTYVKPVSWGRVAIRPVPHRLMTGVSKPLTAPIELIDPSGSSHNLSTCRRTSINSLSG